MQLRLLIYYFRKLVRISAMREITNEMQNVNQMTQGVKKIAVSEERRLRENDDQPKLPLTDLSAWVSEFKAMYTSLYISRAWTMASLTEIMQFFLRNIRLSAKGCYTKPPEAARLKDYINQTLFSFLYVYREISEGTANAIYLSNMSDLLAVYIDMELKASRETKEDHDKIFARLTSCLYTYLENSCEHLLDTLIKVQLMFRCYCHIMDPVIKKIMSTVPSRPGSNDMYIRYFLIYRLWRKINSDPAVRDRISAAAATFLGEAPSSFPQNSLQLILPEVPKSKMHSTKVLLQHKMDLRKSCQLFLEYCRESAKDVHRLKDDSLTPEDKSSSCIKYQNDENLVESNQNRHDSSSPASNSLQSTRTQNRVISLKPIAAKSVKSTKSLSRRRKVKKSKEIIVIDLTNDNVLNTCIEQKKSKSLQWLEEIKKKVSIKSLRTTNSRKSREEVRCRHSPKMSSSLHPEDVTGCRKTVERSPMEDVDVQKQLPSEITKTQLGDAGTSTDAFNEETGPNNSKEVDNKSVAAKEFCPAPSFGIHVCTLSGGSTFVAEALFHVSLNNVAADDKSCETNGIANITSDRNSDLTFKNHTVIRRAIPTCDISNSSPQVKKCEINEHFRISADLKKDSSNSNQCNSENHNSHGSGRIGTVINECVNIPQLALKNDVSSHNTTNINKSNDKSQQSQNGDKFTACNADDQSFEHDIHLNESKTMEYTDTCVKDLCLKNKVTADEHSTCRITDHIKISTEVNDSDLSTVTCQNLASSPKQGNLNDATDTSIKFNSKSHTVKRNNASDTYKSTVLPENNDKDIREVSESNDSKKNVESICNSQTTVDIDYNSSDVQHCDDSKIFISPSNLPNNCKPGEPLHNRCKKTVLPYDGVMRSIRKLQVRDANAMQTMDYREDIDGLLLLASVSQYVPHLRHDREIRFDHIKVKDYTSVCNTSCGTSSENESSMNASSDNVSHFLKGPPGEVINTIFRIYPEGTLEKVALEVEVPSSNNPDINYSSEYSSCGNIRYVSENNYSYDVNDVSTSTMSGENTTQPSKENTNVIMNGETVVLLQKSPNSNLYVINKAVETVTEYGNADDIGKPKDKSWPVQDVHGYSEHVNSPKHVQYDTELIPHNKLFSSQEDNVVFNGNKTVKMEPEDLMTSDIGRIKCSPQSLYPERDVINGNSEASVETYHVVKPDPVFATSNSIKQEFDATSSRITSSCAIQRHSGGHSYTAPTHPANLPPRCTNYSNSTDLCIPYHNHYTSVPCNLERNTATSVHERANKPEDTCGESHCSCLNCAYDIVTHCTQCMSFNPVNDTHGSPTVQDRDQVSIDTLMNKLHNEQLLATMDKSYLGSPGKREVQQLREVCSSKINNKLPLKKRLKAHSMMSAIYKKVEIKTEEGDSYPASSATVTNFHDKSEPINAKLTSHGSSSLKRQKTAEVDTTIREKSSRSDTQPVVVGTSDSTFAKELAYKIHPEESPYRKLKKTEYPSRQTRSSKRNVPKVNYSYTDIDPEWNPSGESKRKRRKLNR